MSHSKRKSPILPITNVKSEKDDKRLASRRERMRVTSLLSNHQAVDPDFDLSEYCWHPRRGQWVFGKDGKFYAGKDLLEQDLKLMRK